MRYHLTPIKIDKIKNTIHNVSKNVEQLKLSHIAGGFVKYYNFRKFLGSFL